MKKFIAFTLVIYLLIFAMGILVQISHHDGFFKASSLILFEFHLIVTYMNIMSYSNNKTKHGDKFVKLFVFYRKRPKNIWEWMGKYNEIEEIKELLSSNSNNDTMVNLLKIKEELILKYRNNPDRLKLIKAHYVVDSKDDYDKTFVGVVISVSVGLLIFGIRELILNSKVLIVPFFDKINTITFTIILVLIGLAVIINDTLKEKKRVNLLIELIQNALDEIKEMKK